MHFRRELATLLVLIITIILMNCGNNHNENSNGNEFSFADSSIAAIVNGEPIRYTEVENTIRQLQSKLKENNHFLGIKTNDSLLWREALNWTISTRLLAQEANRLKIEVENSDVDLALTALKKQFPSEDKFNKVLEDNELSLDQFMKDLENDLRIQKLLEEEITSQVREVSEKDIFQYYETHIENYMQEEKVRVHHILIRTTDLKDKSMVEKSKENALRLRRKLQNGENFEELARQFSEDPSGIKGGDIGFFSKGDMIPEFEETAFGLKMNEISDVIQTPLGFHIIKLIDRKQRQRIPFDEVKQEIKVILKRDQSNTLFKNYVSELRSKARLKIREGA